MNHPCIRDSSLFLGQHGLLFLKIHLCIGSLGAALMRTSFDADQVVVPTTYAS